ncbi:MAG: glycosyltransferase family 9 protein [Bacteriovoracia bacterium]
MKKALVIRFSSLGDITLTLPAVASLVEQGYEVSFLTKRSFAPLVEMSSNVHRIYTIEDHASIFELISILKEIRTDGIDRVFDLHRNLRSLLCIAFLRKPFVRISKHRFKEWLLYVFRKRVFRALGFKRLSRMKDSLHLVSECAFSRFETVETLSKLSSVPSLLFKKDEFVAICVESKWKQKEWNFDRFLTVAEGLKLPIVWLGIHALNRRENDLEQDLTGKLNLKEVASVLSQAKILICNDSGLMHIAESVGTPVLAIFGPTSKELGFGPRLAQSRIVENEGLWCRPCSKTGRACFRISNRQKCLKTVTVDQVLTAAKSMTENLEIRAKSVNVSESFAERST